MSSLALKYLSMTQSTPTVVLVGKTGVGGKTHADTPLPEGFYLLTYDNLVRSQIEQFAPDLIVSSLVIGDHDAIDIAQRLQAAGYDGRYRVLVNDLPDPRMIMVEVARVAPSLDFDVLILSDGLISTPKA